MRIAGFDPGITSPGIALVTRLSVGYQLDEHRVVRTKTKDHDLDRYHQIFRAVAEVLTKWHPVALVIEEQRGAQVGAFKSGQFNGDNSKTLIVVGAAMGAAFAYGVNVVMVRPQGAKIAVLGPKMGNADKKQVQAAVLAITGAQVPQDAADAVALAIAGAQLEPSERVRKGAA